MIQGLSDKVSFPLTNIFIVNSSRKSAHSNAYFYGFWRNQRIVLFDTLLTREDLIVPSHKYVSNLSLKEERYTEVLSEHESSNTTISNDNQDSYEDYKFSKSEYIQGNLDSEKSFDPLSNEEVLAIVCHELGHWVYQHNIKSLVLNEIVLFVYIALFSLLLDNSLFYTRFGFVDSQPIIVGIVIIFGFIFAPIDFLLSFCINFLNRRFEYSADAFAAKMGMGSLLSSAIIKLTRDNKSFPINDPLYSTFHNHHPSTIERLNALKIYKTD
ncbi:CAAX prenyl protease 1-like [Oopsacas minuta]|uniref:CAAX prenyl protease 1-like n=1 Tax=Oopsacas minuta TaxID=111878 RepID=A0AAV7JJJ2_9METZ|nr:CAAX prenyl protease 1-like [Oopsacas minuta]